MGEEGENDRKKAIGVCLQERKKVGAKTTHSEMKKLFQTAQ